MTAGGGGRMDYVQVLFALSPFPSYLPQYFSILRQLSPADGDGNDDSRSPSDEVAAAAHDREGGHHLRKRVTPQHDSPGTAAVAAIAAPRSCNSLQLQGGISPGDIQRKTFDPQNGHQNQNGNCESIASVNSERVDTGMSRATVLLLLSAHLLRLLYFHGLLLEQRTTAPPEAEVGAGMQPGVDGFITPTSASIESIEPQKSVLQWDLLGQSLSMIIVQLMLLHAMMLLRRPRPRPQRKRMSDRGADIAEPPLTRHSPRSDNNFGQKSWRTRLSRTMAAHLRNLFSPHSILQKHSFLEYVELLLLSSMTVKLVFDAYFYPRYRMGTVLWLKHASIVLESCLALPQAIRNWRKGTTEGLSAVMVGGWVAGDFFKLCYFLLDIVRGGGDDGGNRGNGVFALGCLLALALDSIVGAQMAWWYPAPGPALEWRNRIAGAARHWRANKDDDAGESLLAQKKDGILASLLAAFFEWARGIRRPTDS